MRVLLPMTNGTDEEQFFEISAVSRLTGMSTPNIRIWEKRHQVVQPKRSDSKRRQYTAEDVQRLTLLKALVDRGHAIGTIASLTTQQLEQRLAAQEGADQPRPEAVDHCRLLVIGETLREQFRKEEFVSGMQLMASFGALEEVEGWAATSVDVVLIECATLFEDTIPIIQGLIERTQAMRAVIVYQFAQQSTVAMIEKGIRRITPLRAPVNAQELQVVLRADVAMASRSSSAAKPIAVSNERIPPRRFTDQQLAKASQASTTIECECPHHLGSLLANLTAFEQYSSECESRSLADEALHRFLHQTTAQARSMMEHALQEVIDAEGITL
ncbi:MAG: MerR family transcriptional regulator [Verrucomicrobiaceae bacterium]|nr:MerR family transcriptional regulator [Verrucomicrobiaceae bacterium]NCF90756.1 MerR family transcriptional regulator [Verrucomicrobiaceae bacterium]